MLDLRIPIGLMFSLIGALLAVYGFYTRARPGMYDCSLGININLIWGLVLLAFGAVMLFVSLKKKPQESDRKN